MTAPIDDLCLDHQPREQAVTCWCGRPTWNHSALCDLHEISDATPTASGAGPSNPAGRHDRPHPVVSAPFSQASVGLGGEPDPAPAAPDRHGSAAVPVTSSPAADARGFEHAATTARSNVDHDHGRTRDAGPHTGTPTGVGVVDTFT